MAFSTAAAGPTSATADAALPTATFGILALNAEPLLDPCVRALVPFAHQIIVVEGASPYAAACATADGHSLDGTLDTLQSLQREFGEVICVVTAEDEGNPSGFWRGEKDEQSRAYAARATGEILWQVDADEFYLPSDMARVLGWFRDDPALTGVAFDWWNFWGSFDAVVDGWYYRDNMATLGGNRRVFRWGSGYSYASHRPPTVLDAAGHDLARGGRFLWAADTRARGVRCYHYGMVFEAQARQKAEYYGALPMTRDSGNYRDWYEHSWRRLERPYGVLHGTREPSWLTRFVGRHPPAIEKLLASRPDLMNAAERVRAVNIANRLSSRWYSLGASTLAHAYRWRAAAREVMAAVAPGRRR